jgi:hypothetical protein
LCEDPGGRQDLTLIFCVTYGLSMFSPRESQRWPMRGRIGASTHPQDADNAAIIPGANIEGGGTK